MLAYEEVSPTSTGALTIDRVGTIAGSPDRAFPRLKSQLGLSWSYGGFDLTLTPRFISSLTEPCLGLSAFPGTCSHVDPVDPDNLSTNHLAAMVYNDLQLVWSPDFDHGLTVTAGVNNVLDRDPPDCFNCALNGFNATTYDVPGVFGYVTAAYHVQ